MNVKKLLSVVLVLAMFLTMIPANVFVYSSALAQTTGDGGFAQSQMKGDINGDGTVDTADVRVMLRKIVGLDAGFTTDEKMLVDMNNDGKANSADAREMLLLAISTHFTVTFVDYDDERVIDTLIAEKGQPLGAVPSVEKSSKANAILLGYYTDAAFTQPFYAENPVTCDMTVYAKYEEMGSTEELNFTSFAQMDQTPDLSFEVVGAGDPFQAITLEVKDGSDPVELKFEATEGGYIVSAVGGFNEGCSYQLHLADGWTFKDKPETIRAASFSIAMEEVDNIRMGDDIVYINQLLCRGSVLRCSYF